MEPRRLYRFAAQEVLARVPNEPLTLVHAFPGLTDTGNTCKLLTSFLEGTCLPQTLAEFDTDELLDYRGTYLQAYFVDGGFAPIQIPRIELKLMRDESDKPFLFLSGPDPDMRWLGLRDAVIELIDIFDVRRVVSLMSFPMNVPHTRPIRVMEYAGVVDTPPDSLDQLSQMMAPTPFNIFLSTELARHGIDTLGYVAQVPHYMARRDFEPATLALLRRLSESAGLDLQLVDLGDDCDVVLAQADQSARENEEVAAHVAQLEQIYDEALEDEIAAPLRVRQDTPTGDEIATRFERFLASQEGEKPSENGENGSEMGKKPDEGGQDGENVQ
ncbi:PAC2 family protein [Dermabacteraceae bacterium TAE3-ERU27]|nr:PAC2 family protein [Dermabacteraceae bacterium TAE3-ERU27]